ncbi:ester cyclase [Chloroflexota bacterium]
MSVEENKNILQRIWEEAFNEGNIEIIDELYTADFIYHGPGGYEIKGREGLKKLVTMLHTSFTDLHFTVDNLIAEADKVVSVWTMRGKYKGNKQVTNPGIIVSQIVDGKVTEDWEIYDRLYLAQQVSPGWIAKAMVNSIAKQTTKDLP